MSQQVDEAVIERLSLLLASPASYVERRTDRVEQLGRDSITWLVTQQIVLPEIEGDEPNSARDALITLGFFDKKRHPDLDVRGQDGLPLPIVDRDLRARIITELWAQQLSRIGVAAERAEQITANVSKMIRASEPETRDLFKRTIELAEQDAALNLRLPKKLLEKQLRGLAGTNHVLVWVRATPGERVTFTYRYTETLPYPTFEEACRAGGRLGLSRLWYMLRWLLMNLGLLAVPIRLTLNGANHSRAFFFLVDPPPGTEIEACYWHSLKTRDSDAMALKWGIPHDSSSTILACRHDEQVAGRNRRVSVDLRIAPERLVLPLLLVTIIAATAWIGRSEPKGNLQDLLPLLAVVPGALLGILVDRVGELGRRMSRALQMELVVVALLAVSYGCALQADLFDNGSAPGWLSDETLNSALTLASVWTLGPLAYVVVMRSKARGTRSSGAYLDYKGVEGYRRHRRSMAVLVGGVSAASAVYLAFNDVDASAHQWINRNMSEDPAWAWTLIDRLSSAAFVLPAMGIMFAVQAARRAFRDAAIVLWSTVLLVLVVAMAKSIVDRPRPSGMRIVLESGGSMPSGHVALVVFASIMIYQHLVTGLSHRPTRAAVTLLLLVSSSFVMFERLLSNSHFLSDIIVGATLGGVVAIGGNRLRRL